MTHIFALLSILIYAGLLLTERQAGETSAKIEHLNEELVSLKGQQLNGRIRLYETVP